MKRNSLFLLWSSVFLFFIMGLVVLLSSNSGAGHMNDVIKRAAGFSISEEYRVERHQKPNSFLSMFGHHNEYYLLCLSAEDFSNLVDRIEASGSWKKIRDAEYPGEGKRRWERIAYSEDDKFEYISKVSEYYPCYHLYIFDAF